MRRALFLCPNDCISMTESEASKIYDKIIQISGDVGQIKADMDTVKANVDDIKADMRENYVSSEEADRRADEKLEKYYQQAKDRQDSIRDSLIKIIADDQQRIKVLEDWKKDTAHHGERIRALEDWRNECTGKVSKSIMYWLTKARDYVIWAAILALVGVLFKYSSALAEVLHSLATQPPLPR